jgi:hypothetical protein
MSKGYLLVAMGDNYIKQACLCALSIKKTQTLSNVSIMTSDIVPNNYKHLFDEIIEIPWWTSDRSFYGPEHRWKVFHITPYEETIVLDTDTIFLNNVDYIWNSLQGYSVGFLTDVKTYRGTTVVDNFYRQVFVKNNLPNIYNAFHYFKKDDIALDYYKHLELVCKNSKEFYNIHLKKLKPKVTSMDVNHAIAILSSNLQTYEINSLNFIHMKSKVQGWKESNESWIHDIPFYFDDDYSLKIGNYQQSGVFHYVDHKFCNEVIGKYHA